MEIFKENDIKGLYPENWDKNTAYKIGTCLPEIISGKNIVIGRDGRESSNEILDISKQLHVKPKNCVYVGDVPNRDVEGPRRTEFDLNVILKTSNYPEGKELSYLQTPYITVDNLMDMFPKKRISDVYF